MKEYGMRKFVPGQIIFATINTSALNGDITKNRPYLIIASNNRRIVVLKMTHNGEYSSNWIYSLEDIDGQTSNIICDCPITVNVSTIIENYTHDKFLTPELFKDVFKKYLAAMIHQSVEDFLDDPETVDSVRNEIHNHDERLLSYSRLAITYSDDNDISDDEETESTEDRDTIIEMTPTPIPVSEPAPTVTVTHKLGSVKPGAEAAKVAKSGSKSKKRSYAHYRRLDPTRDYILATDCFLFNKGWTKSDDISIALSKLGLKNSKFIMDDLKNRNRVVYMNNKYNVTLKSGLITNKTKTSSNAKEYAREIIADCENVGFEKAGLIWARGTEFMRKNYWKFKEELSSKSYDEAKGA